MHLSSFLRVWRWRRQHPPPRDVNIYLPLRTYTHYFLLLSCTLAVLGRMFSVLYSVLTLISTSCYVKDCCFVLGNCLFLAFYITQTFITVFTKAWIKIYTKLRPQRDISCTMDKTSLMFSVLQPVKLNLSFSWTTSPKLLSLAKVITTNVLANRMHKRLEGHIGRNVRAWGRCGRSRVLI